MHEIRIGNLDGVIDLRHDLVQWRQYPWRPLNQIKYLVVHHSAVAWDSTALAIHNYHRDVLGWPGIGYHFLVHQTGVIEYVGDVMQMRYNVANRNHEVVGVCLPGDFTNEPPSPPQLVSAHHILANLQWALGWFVSIVGHKEIALPDYATACPGNTWSQWAPILKKGLEHNGQTPN